MKGNFKRYRGYCDRCDIGAPANGERCSYCGVKRRAQSKLKKPKTKEIIEQENKE